MKKRVLFLTILFLISFMFINNFKAKTNYCSTTKKFSTITTKNIYNKLTKEKLNNILKICTNNICTYKLHKNINSFVVEHEKRVVNNIRNEERKIETELKGSKIDSIYFKSCI